MGIDVEPRPVFHTCFFAPMAKSHDPVEASPWADSRLGMIGTAVTLTLLVLSLIASIRYL